jgi:hypothetical protein
MTESQMVEQLTTMANNGLKAIRLWKQAQAFKEEFGDWITPDWLLVLDIVVNLELQSLLHLEKSNGS